ncbi:acyltransferase domain-containing protein [Chelatococcus asaccharovorans]|uniref:acyltransferase domain-containing protein n=1 Tax=Chelatococcus asaccharovorans TaxID=28210 RepID=UPI00224C77B8|nr:acyltransferase domain-containing protein [Chelatococcus asaccharovorans]CAH1657017.1 Malonyl CoA acyl carrier protein transacylase [Chelatococcus asaccharovorans]CAH1684915.1 Malonyl CoA acyl carrier protein transacylase [Chelatococcus asaccharovorans]
MSIAILCSGQGRQHPAMFALTGDAPAAANLFTHATGLLGGRDPRVIVQSASPEALYHDRTAQILCTLQAVAAAAALGDALSGQLVVAGYSIGELAAWGVSGRLDPIETLNLAAERAEAMDAVSQSGEGLLFVRGLPRPVIDALCQTHGTAIAIINPADAYVIGGSLEALAAVAAEARGKNATRITPLPVEVASHTPRLARASAAFGLKLRGLTPTAEVATSARLLSGIDGLPVMRFKEGLDKLAAQISRTVHWADCLQACVENRARAFFELGPGSTLSRMASAAHPGIPARSLEDFQSLQGASAWIARKFAD